MNTGWTRTKSMGVAAFAMGLTLAGMMLAYPAAGAEPDFCPPGYGGPDNGAVSNFDSNVGVFAGGNFSAIQQAAEAEGVLLVGGNADFSKSPAGTYNVGVVGVGSRVPPPPGSAMLLVGGDLSGSAGTSIDVGSGIGGAVRAGGNIRVRGKLETNGADYTENDATALKGYESFGATVRARSNDYSALPTTGSSSNQWGTLTLIGDGSSATQVFSIAGDQMGTASNPVSLQITHVPVNAKIIVNVKGAAAGLNLNTVLGSGGTPMDPFTDPQFPLLAQKLVWNFPDTTSLIVGGSAQIPGTIMVPSAAGNTTISAPGTNGRILIGGNLTHAGAGSEMHSYPLMDDSDFGCTAAPAPEPSETTARAPEPSETTARAPEPSETTAPAPEPSETTAPAPGPLGELPNEAGDTSPAVLASTGANAGLSVLAGVAVLLVAAGLALGLGVRRRH